jgi:cephalosporin hydroxylase
VTVEAEPSLRELALAMRTDKEGAHAYAAPYERHIARLRHQPVTLLEIGIGGYSNQARGGASLRMWKAYFPAGTIIGLDIEDKSQFAEERITILQGDQGDRAFLRDLATRYGPFDIVIDDGSHRSEHVIASFEALFPHLRDGGVYVVEDLQAS